MAFDRPLAGETLHFLKWIKLSDAIKHVVKMYLSGCLNVIKILSRAQKYDELSSDHLNDHFSKPISGVWHLSNALRSESCRNSPQVWTAHLMRLAMNILGVP